MIDIMQTSEHSTGLPTRMQAMRSRLRAAGMRPVQIWVPDVRLPRIAEEAMRQSRVASGRASDADAMAFIGSCADTGEEG